MCACQDGFLLNSDEKTCDDIDECADEHIRGACEHDCVNDKGG